MSRQPDVLRAQYQDDRNLNARIALHAQFSTNPYGWSRWVFDRFAFPEPARILELGCGPGNLWSANQHRISPDWHVTLTDFSPGMVSTARDALASKRHTFRFVSADAQTLPFAEATFDAVIANHMLYHVPDRCRALLEARRVMKAEGTFYATTVGDTHMQEMWELLVPFVPDIHDRRKEISRGFTLENGRAQLAQVFNHVEVHAYPDDLEVTDAELLMAYLKSSPTAIINDLTPAQWEAIRAAAAQHIAVAGAFHIHKASGIFIASVR